MNPDKKLYPLSPWPKFQTTSRKPPKIHPEGMLLIDSIRIPEAGDVNARGMVRWVEAGVIIQMDEAFIGGALRLVRRNARRSVPNS
jgi:hypothetical protein